MTRGPSRDITDAVAPLLASRRTSAGRLSLAPRGAGVSAAPTLSAPAADKEKLKTPAVQAQRAKPRHTFKDRHVLDNLPARIEEPRVLKARLQSLLDDTGLYARSPAKFAEADAALAEAEGEWIRLAILNEESAGERNA